ncbi:MAG: exosortase system-associated protein, TIGR04073 family [Candidatus Hydrogenedens sp.]|nr:exosortase system-associated protein, TIGR04073 family [Candidatus Hydrogenedens sp.]
MLGWSKKLGLGVVALLITVALIIPAYSVQAQIYDPDVDLPKPTGLEKRLEKLGRGVSNILWGWAEIPVTFDKKLKEGKPFAYLFGVAPVLGTARAIMRTSTGVFEAVSFPFSDDDINFEAVLEPEYIF